MKQNGKKQPSLALYMNSERVGVWRLTAQGHELMYDKEWLANPLVRPISLQFPLTSDVIYRQGVENYFDNLLPDAKAIRERLATRYRAASTKAIDLLEVIGRDCAGALQILPIDDTPPTVKRIDSRPLSEGDIEALLHDSVSSNNGLFRQNNDDPHSAQDFRFSLAGAQEKIALLKIDDRWHLPLGTTPTTHILKLPLGLVGNMQADMRDSVDNEWLCALILRAYGLPIAECEPATFGRYRVLVVKRFDRYLSADKTWWMRLPQEDLCQATGTSYLQKYESDGGPGIERILTLLSLSRQAKTDRQHFFAAQVIFWLLAATDGHAKNFSIRLHVGGSFDLAPLYDVLSAHPLMGKGAGQLSPFKIKMAMAIRGKNAHYAWRSILKRHWLEMLQQTRLDAVDALTTDPPAWLDALVAQTPAVIAAVGRMLPQGFPARVSDPIFEGMTRAANQLLR
jgi:serine/threonine-protein kinase HipA